MTPLRRNRDFLLLWGGQAAASLGGNVAAVAHPFLALLATGSAAGAARWRSRASPPGRCCACPVACSPTGGRCARC
ncbi:hypothetical protein [Virgisporangium ochraceum]|uniref:MFS transporter n=1 Tax=Virgisporangium ochraceum TaxID=65505 RepID=A0A8J3ZRA3_9ACTN|nr:hypothetical protein [Virgisporangium ochraceum]GIJ67578.1 hypothetical protein Voc01_024950 [Virgisporangium ochraceum]